MIINQHKAHEFWCPFARVPLNESFGANRTEDGDIGRACTCLGPQCIAWRWLDDARVSGYCGLAGRPVG